MATRIALVVFPGFQILDLSALTVFELANLHLTDRGKDAHYAMDVVSQDGGLVPSSSGVAIQTRPIGRRHYDTLMVGGAVEIPASTPALIASLRRVARRTRRVASICTGAFLLAEAGLLDGRPATTHWALAHELQRRYPAIRMDEDKIFVSDGVLWTSAGMTACIDLALALLSDDLGPDAARAVARKMVIHYRRSGGQSQFSTLAELEPDSDRIRAALDYARENLREPLSVEQLADQVHWSPRHFSRAFQAQTGLSPAKAVEKLRLEAARALIEEGESSIARVATLTGFGDEERMRRAFLRTLGRPPRDLQREARRRTSAAPLAGLAATA
ncbi:AraC family transcriptional regulator [Bordetella genomosp. 9]|uniref:AraC family transcriptional regulator n=1 Tax=Bordetella genomosp. 9 TaxID=1416803 RepID=A0A261RND8_9BORD|nr:helix-turn-helix domain-containing protein [Bordetella genomosp. 9]OZI25823.1 AraC family transcriptional regulator [Bordetella genomosp. 9]